MRQFDRPTINPASMRKMALQELTFSSKRRKRRLNLRIMLPPWLSALTNKNVEELNESMNQKDE